MQMPSTKSKRHHRTIWQQSKVFKPSSWARRHCRKLKQVHSPRTTGSVTSGRDGTHDNSPIRMWNPHDDVTPAIHKSCPPARLPTSPAPAVIEDAIEKFDAHLIPIVANSPARRHYVRPPQAQPITRSQLMECTTHMINSAVSNALMPRLVTATANTPLAIGYAFAVHQLVLLKLANNHFFGIIIAKDTGTVLEYRCLGKNPATNWCGKQVLQTK